MIKAQTLTATGATLADYIELAKPRLTALVLATVAFGFGLAGPADWSLLGVTLVGTALAAGGSSALNMVMERAADAKMRRTCNRPIPSGRVAPGEALALGTLACGAGVVLLSARAGATAGLLTAATVAIYLFAYTPLKRRSALATPVGAVSGALPPLIGWAAAGRPLEAGAWLLFAVLFFWQMPHFLAIAWLYREDYARAGMPMLPVVEPDGASTARQMVLNTLALIVASLAPFWWGRAGAVYAAAALALGAILLGGAAMFWARRSTASARAVFVASLVYLPALLALMAGGL
jgi:protoheme IX farnesyltransferase